MPLGLPQMDAVLLAGGPTTVHTVIHPNGGESRIGAAERRLRLEAITGHVNRFAAQGAFWPGDALTAAPAHPPQMPYAPLRP